MGTVLIHSGMRKTGSTSIQTWLRRHATHLREVHRISLLHVSETAGGPSRFEVVEAPMNVHTVSFVLWYHVTRQRPPRAPESTRAYLYAAPTDLITRRSGN